MVKKITAKTPKTSRKSNAITTTTGNANVIDLVGKLEKKVEKQMAGFVKEIVRLKKAQEQLNKKVTQTSKTRANTSKTPKTKSVLDKKKAKRTTSRKLRLV